MTVINQFHRLQFLLFIGAVFISTAQFNAAVSFKSLSPSENVPQNELPIAIQGGLLIGSTDLGNSVWLDNKKVRVASDGIFIIDLMFG